MSVSERFMMLPNDIRRYGATQDPGSNSACVAVRAAFADGHRSVYVPPGEWEHTTVIGLSSGQTLYGDGEASVLRYTSETASAAILISSDGGREETILRDLKIVGARSEPLHGILVNDGAFVAIKRVAIEGAPGELSFSAAAITLYGHCETVRIKHCKASWLGGHGVSITGPQGSDGSFPVKISDCYLNANRGYGVCVVGDQKSVVHVVDNVIQGNSLGGIYAEVLWASRITGNHFENADGVAPDSEATLVRIGKGLTSPALQNCPQAIVLSSNIFAVKRARCAVDISCYSSTTRTVDGVCIEGNFITGGQAVDCVDAAIKLTGVFSGVRIVANHAHGPFASKLVKYYDSLLDEADPGFYQHAHVVQSADGWLLTSKGVLSF